MKLSDESLEQLAIAVAKLRNQDGTIPQLYVYDVLQEWVWRQYPATCYLVPSKTPK